VANHGFSGRREWEFDAVKEQNLVQLQVLQAQRTYPTDEVLKQIDENMGSEPARLHKAEKRRILERLNARLAELQGGG
jgi:hypothetical protein